MRHSAIGKPPAATAGTARPHLHRAGAGERQRLQKRQDYEYEYEYGYEQEARCPGAGPVALLHADAVLGIFPGCMIFH
jgi:hypothetical protein